MRRAGNTAQERVVDNPRVGQVDSPRNRTPSMERPESEISAWDLAPRTRTSATGDRRLGPSGVCWTPIPFLSLAHRLVTALPTTGHASHDLRHWVEWSVGWHSWLLNVEPSASAAAREPCLNPTVMWAPGDLVVKDRRGEHGGFGSTMRPRAGTTLGPQSSRRPASSVAGKVKAKARVGVRAT